MEAGSALDAARRALAGGDSAAALRLLERREDPAALHLRALAERRAGRLEDARRTFTAALAMAPGDPELANNFANLLRQMDAQDEALRLYDRALVLRPGYRDATFNKALLLSQRGEDTAALGLLDKIVARHIADAPAHSARGTVLRQLGRHGDAAAAYDAALRAAPQLPTALRGRAQIALERGEADAAARFERALQAAPGDLELIYGYVEALEAGGDDRAAAVLEEVLAARPEWTAGHQLLARVRAERGDANWAAPLIAAAARRPGDRGLALAVADTLSHAERWNEALAILPPGEQRDLVIRRAHYLCESGAPADALALIADSAAAAAETAVIVARAHIRLGAPDRAAEVLERAVAAHPAAIGVWGHLELAWRTIGDERSAWLSGGAELIRAGDIGLSAAELEETAAHLRALHRTRAHPLGQSLRGGTQTRGALFVRPDPLLARLRAALEREVERYRAALPPTDPAHPLLRHRDARLRMGGSWSVRLTGSGYHVHHIHSDGVLSSACYLALPDLTGDPAERAGWLELGRPPAELGLALDPIAAIEPRVGRLALFPSYLFHGTRPFANGERLSVAFDVVPA